MSSAYDFHLFFQELPNVSQIKTPGVATHSIRRIRLEEPALPTSYTLNFAEEEGSQKHESNASINRVNYSSEVPPLRNSARFNES